MAPALIYECGPVSSDVGSVNIDDMKADKQTSILHRTPWRPPVAVSANGIYIQLDDGRTLVDGVGGASVACIGNGHPDVAKAIKEQVDRMAYVYNMQLSNEPAEQLAKYLVSTGNGAFELCGLVSGGSEAMEGAMKVACQYFQDVGQSQRTNFIGRHLSFHGNTLATLSLADNPARRAPYTGILDSDHFHHVSPAYAKRFQKLDESEEQYVERLRMELEEKFIELGPETVIGFVAETVGGATTGCLTAPKGYFKAMKSVCDKYGALFILDEVMCGMGRMGVVHAWEIFGDGIAPDIQAIAKGLGGGYASIGAVLISSKVSEGIRGWWKHGHTYQAHPLACAASLAVQQVIATDNLLEKCRIQGAYLGDLLRERLATPGSITAPFTFDIRGGGCFWGIEFDFSCPEGNKFDFKNEQFATLVQARCFANGLVIMAFTGGSNVEGTKGHHAILSPAFNVTRKQVEDIVDIFVKSVEEVLTEYQT